MLKFIIIYLLIGGVLYLVSLRGFIKGFRDNPSNRALHAYMFFGSILLWPVAVFSGIKALVRRVMKRGPNDQDAMSPE